MSRTAHLARLERERLLILERRGRARAEALAVTQGIAETVALSQARGAAMEAPATPRKPHRRQAGLEWLARQGRLNDQQKQAGERYGKQHQHPTLLAACDLVCGQELTPREAARTDREAGRLEAVLEVALDLLAQEGAAQGS